MHWFGGVAGTGAILLIHTCLLLTGYESVMNRAVSSQTPAPSSLEPEILKPVGQINPGVPLSVILINQTTQKLEYGLTTNEPRQLAAGAKATHSRIPIPAYGVIYPIESASEQDNQSAFKFDVSAQKNVITVKIRQIEDGSEGNSVIRVRKSGGIFVY